MNSANQIACETCLVTIDGEGNYHHEPNCKIELMRKEIVALQQSIINFENKIEEYINQFGENAPQEVCKEIIEQIQARREKRGQKKSLKDIIKETEEQLQHTMTTFIGDKEISTENTERLKTLALDTLARFEECPENVRQHIECIVGLETDKHLFIVGYRGLTPEGITFLNWIEEQKKELSNSQ